MRKREIASIVKELKALHETILRSGLGQIEGGIWYFENNADIKGYNFCYAACSQLEAASQRLRYLLDKQAGAKSESFFERQKYDHKNKACQPEICPYCKLVKKAEK